MFSNGKPEIQCKWFDIFRQEPIHTAGEAIYKYGLSHISRMATKLRLKPFKVGRRDPTVLPWSISVGCRRQFRLDQSFSEPYQTLPNVYEDRTKIPTI